MNFYQSSGFSRAYDKIIRKNPFLIPLIKERIHLFQTHQNHPSLKVHKLTGSKHEAWSFSVAHDLRILFSRVPDGFIFVDIGSHD
ncbi:type II toxin-antitoxin system mRNA interferase toxin, RelE/StbE family [Candidatus Gottesmanbacteria bacterium]|nr:type II toxin-antitoxin system mRNA interferase toxin, RelE/StbE family [Candidatus Gottesmanbacteria bacterium]